MMLIGEGLISRLPTVSRLPTSSKSLRASTALICHKPSQRPTMATYRPRPPSPPGSRRYPDPRSTNPTVIASSFDTRYSQAPRAGVDGLPPPRAVGESSYEAHPIKKRIYPDSGHSATKSKTDYAVRPRHKPLVEESRRPLSIVVSSNSSKQNRPLVNNAARDRPRSPLPKPRQPREDAQHLVYPAATSARESHHQHYRRSSGDVDRLPVSDRERRDRKVYHGQRGYPASGALVLYQYNDDDFSYTGPREQFARDYPDQAPSRRDSYARRERPERPRSGIDYPEMQTSTQGRRDLGPPPSSARHFDRIDRPDVHRLDRRGGVGSDSEARSDVPKRRHSTRTPVALHHQSDDGYSSQRDDYDDRRYLHYSKQSPDDGGTYASDRDPRRHHNHHRERRKSRTARESPDRSELADELGAVSVGGAAVAGLTGAQTKDSKERERDSDLEAEARKERRRLRRRERERRHEDERELQQTRLPDQQDRVRDRLSDPPLEAVAQKGVTDQRQEKPRKEQSDSESIEDPLTTRHHHHRRRKHRPKDELAREAESETSLDVEVPTNVVGEDLRRDTRDGDAELDELDRNRRHNRSRDQASEAPVFSGGSRVMTPLEIPQERPKRVQVVEPTKEKETDFKPRGILKPARQVPFPEDPNPTREGVAPLKEAGKKGVPSGARWTKINRKLVNPAALEAIHERFEERDGYVIVLRVLTREEIQKLADVTKEIRGKISEPHPIKRS